MRQDRAQLLLRLRALSSGETYDRVPQRQWSFLPLLLKDAVCERSGEVL